MGSVYWWSFILLIPAVVLGIYAQARVSSVFNRYCSKLQMELPYTRHIL